MQLIKSAWHAAKEFAGFTGAGTCLWPRWLVLRLVGVVYVIIFAGILVEGGALIGPHGIYPVAEYTATLRGIFPNFFERFLRAPSAFWLSSSPAMISFCSWAGMAAAVALVLNLWPRVALFVCWAMFLSFVATWHVFSSSIDDQLMIETALLCIAFAPAGLRPGLGADSPPRPIALFMLRWLLFRLMLGSGLIKIFTPDPHWRDLTPMDVMYETSPLPTILGYWDQHLPFAYHCFEIGLTFVAEIIAPLLAVFGGRRGRWWAFLAWVAFQAGIELTTSFGWLNAASMALGLLLLDDQMLATAAGKFRLKKLAAWLGAPRVALEPRVIGPLKLYGLRALLGIYFCLTVYFTGILFAGRGRTQAPKFWTDPLSYLFRDFKSANAYAPYGKFPDSKLEIEFQGSNDGGRTWRAYGFKFKPQQPDKICRWVAPWFPRFEATLQLAVNLPHTLIMARTATRLLERNPEVLHLFRTDPFGSVPPTMIRLPVYRFTFTTLDEHRATGAFWHKTYVGDYGPAMVIGKDGAITEMPYSIYEEARIAFATYVSGSELEARAALVDLTTRLRANGPGVTRSPADYPTVMAGAYLRLAGIYGYEGDTRYEAEAMANAIQFSEQLAGVAENPAFQRDKPGFLLANILAPMEESDRPAWKYRPNAP